MFPTEAKKGNDKPLKVECLEGSYDLSDNTGIFSATCNMCEYWVESHNDDPEETWNVTVRDRDYLDQEWYPADHTVADDLDKKSAIAAVEEWAAKHTAETCLAAQKEAKEEYEAELAAEENRMRGELHISTCTEHYDCDMDLQTAPMETEYDIEAVLMSNSLVADFAEAGLDAETMHVSASCFHTGLDYSSTWETSDGEPGTYDSFWSPKDPLPNPCKHENETWEKHWTHAETGKQQMSIICGDCQEAVIIGVPTEI